MLVSELLANITMMQAAFKTLSMMQFTATNWPQNAEIKDGDTFDVIIVGAGTAGSVLAKRLTDVPHMKVLVLEAGGDPPLEAFFAGLNIYLPNTYMDWNYTSIPDEQFSPMHKDFVQRIKQGKLLGGSSSLGFLVYARGHPSDYDYWATITNDTSWRYDNILKYFKKSETFVNVDITKYFYGVFFGHDGPIHVSFSGGDIGGYIYAFAELEHLIKICLYGDETLGYSGAAFTVHNNIKHSAGFSYLPLIRKRSSLLLSKNSLVSKVVFEGKKAVGVEVEISGKKIQVKAKKEVILSAGAINTPQILMLSGVGPKKHLEDFNISVVEDLPVGKNFQDHMTVMVYLKMENDSNPVWPADPNEIPAPTIVGYVALNKTQSFPDYQTYLRLTHHDSTYPIAYCSLILGFKDQICQVIADITGRNLITALVTRLHPKFRGEIRLRSANISDNPIIDLNNNPEDDYEELAKYLEDFVKIVNTTYYRAANAEIIDFKLKACKNYTGRQFWKCYAHHLRTSQWNYAGTCAMGAVVDKRLKVKGVENLRVVDASVIPLLPSGDIGMPVVMIAEKASDMINFQEGR